MNITEVSKMIENAGLVLIEKKRLVEIRENVNQILDEYAPYKWDGRDIIPTDIHKKLRGLRMSIDITAVQAGIVQCVMPECTRNAEIVTPIGNAHFCRPCFTNNQHGCCK